LEISANTTYDVPLAALRAYRRSAAEVASSCHLSWGVVAAIGQVESAHGKFGGASVLANGTTYPLILGLPLDGVGPVAAIHDTDHGKLDHDRVWDRAVGPMQFIPSTWAVVGADGDGNGKLNPSDFDDAALATARYLCGGGADMRVLTQARGAVFRYNQSNEYVDLVLTLANAYDSGVVDVVPNDVAPPKSKRPHHRSPRRSHETRLEQPTPDGQSTHHPRRPHRASPASHRRRPPDPSPAPAAYLKPRHQASPQPAPAPSPNPQPQPPRPRRPPPGTSDPRADANAEADTDTDTDAHAEADTGTGTGTGAQVVYRRARQLQHDLLRRRNTGQVLPRPAGPGLRRGRDHRVTASGAARRRRPGRNLSP
nr:lytic transglycosylase domain-containing protein [Nocardioidaceae bacterium]